MSLPKNRQVEELFKSILALKSTEECYKYFEDLCTVKEVLAFSQRLEVAKLLDRGSSYSKAVEQTGVSSATIGRVKHCLDYGTGGYRLILDRLVESDKEEKEVE